MTVLNTRPAMTVASLEPQLAHALWRADQLGSWQKPVTSSGHSKLDRELPDGGWPHSSLVELLLQQPGIGEIRLLRPALAALERERCVVFLQPPQAPQAAAWAHWGLPPERLLWVRARREADALWSAEQILKNGSCGALLFWQSGTRPEFLRRLHLAAQGSNTLFWMLRPLAAAATASPAPLRLALRPAAGGIELELLKRRGPRRDAPLYLALQQSGAAAPHAIAAAPAVSPAPLFFALSPHATLDSPAPAAAAAAAAASIPAALV